MAEEYALPGIGDDRAAELIEKLDSCDAEVRADLWFWRSQRRKETPDKYPGMADFDVEGARIINRIRSDWAPDPALGRADEFMTCLVLAAAGELKSEPWQWDNEYDENSTIRVALLGFDEEKLKALDFFESPTGKALLSLKAGG